MAAITWTDVTDYAPELSIVSAGAQTLILNYVNTALDVSVFDGEDGPKTKFARVLLASHLGKLGSMGGMSVAGPVISETVGDISRAYANLVSVGAGMFSGSLYGDLFNQLVQTCPKARVPLVI